MNLWPSLIAENSNLSSWLLRSKGSVVNCSSWGVVENGSNLVFNLLSPLLVEFKGLEVFVNVGYLGEPEDQGADISVGKSPGKSKLGLSVAKLGGKSSQGFKGLD